MTEHPGDKVLNAILRLFPRAYNGAKKQAEQRLAAFLRPKERTFRQKLSPKEYARRLQLVFTGLRWLMVRRKIATLFTDADAQATEYVNDGLYEAFERGFNQSARIMGLVPITAFVVKLLASEGLFDIPRRTLKRSEDMAHNEHRVQTGVMSAILQGIDFDKIPAYVAEHIARIRQNEMTAFSRATIYGASDMGAYYAGREAEHEGLDIEKTWLSIMDMRVRPSHKHLHGVTIKMDDMFHGYHGDLRFPHDPSAPPAEVYNCRCRMLVHLAGRTTKIPDTMGPEYQKWREKEIMKAGTEVELARIHRKKLR